MRAIPILRANSFAWTYVINYQGFLTSLAREKAEICRLKNNYVVESAVLATRTESSFVHCSNSNNKDWPICSHCGLRGHTIDYCYRVHGFPPWYRNGGREGQMHQAAVFMVPRPTLASEAPNLTLSQAQS